MTTETTETTERRWNKPLPNIDLDNKAFWDGLRDHQLLLWTCSTCGTQYWPKCYCIKHENEPYAQNMSWQPGSGRGKIFALNRHHWAFHPGFQDELPYIYALIELDEGPLISTTIVGKQPTDLVSAVGEPVQIVYEDYAELGFTIPRFELIDA
ncbi:MAG: OB-fold domain-containing protein [Mycobacteriales bacterium]